MTTLFVILAIIALAVVSLAAYVATRPNSYRVERTEQLHAPAPVVFEIINDLHQWHRWSPYDKRDPEMKKTFKGRG